MLVMEGAVSQVGNLITVGPRRTADFMRGKLNVPMFCIAETRCLCKEYSHTIIPGTTEPTGSKSLFLHLNELKYPTMLVSHLRPHL